MQIVAWHGKTSIYKPGGEIVGADLSVPNLMYRKFNRTCSGKARLATTLLKVAEGLIKRTGVVRL
ncbi:MAG: hypothetical protein AAB067_08455 [Planctomycetota bacterium]